MKKSTLLLAASLLPLLSACNSIAPNSAAASVATTPEAAWVGEARQVAGSVPPKLMAVLKPQLAGKADMAEVSKLVKAALAG